jgi:GT2 family glycosyltransferase
MMDASPPVVVITDGDQPLLMRAVARVRTPLWLVAPDGGFAAAANAALERARSEGFSSIILLNDDAVLLPGAREALAREVSRPGVGAAGALLLEEDGRTVQSAGLSVRLRGGRVRALRPANPPAGSSRTVAALPATALALRVERALAVGGFDAGRFPFYFEDVDLCLRLRAAGYRVVLTPAARAIHRGGASAGRGSAFATYHATLGQLALCRAHPAPHPVAPLVAAALSAATLLRRGDDPRAARARALLRGIREGWRTPAR